MSLPSGVRGCAMITVPERPRQTAQTPRSSGSLGPRGSCGPALPLRAAALVGGDLHVAGPTSAIWFAAPIATNGLPFGGCRPPFGGRSRSAAPKAPGGGNAIAGAGRKRGPGRAERRFVWPCVRRRPSRSAALRPSPAVDPLRNSRSRNSGARQERFRIGRPIDSARAPKTVFRTSRRSPLSCRRRSGGSAFRGLDLSQDFCKVAPGCPDGIARTEIPDREV